MSKKEFLLQIMDTFQRANNLPADLQQNLQKIKQELHARSTVDVEVETTSVVTTTATEEGENPDWLSAMLYDVLKEMDKLAQANEETNPELVQACHMLRGELGMAIDSPFP